MENENQSPGLQEEREQALTAREREITRRELRAGAAEQLQKRGLPGELIDAMSYTDEETLTRALDAMESAFRKALREDIASRMRASPPRAAGETPLRDARRMGYQERARLYVQDRRRYNDLFPN